MHQAAMLATVRELALDHAKKLNNSKVMTYSETSTTTSPPTLLQQSLSARSGGKTVNLKQNQVNLAQNPVNLVQNQVQIQSQNQVQKQVKNHVQKQLQVQNLQLQNQFK